MDENTIYEALGLSPEGEGGKEQEVADPDSTAQQPTGTGAKEQETAEPAAEGSNDTAGTETGGEEAEGNEALTEEQRRNNAAQRRRAEQQAAVDKALEKERAKFKAEWDTFFQKAQLKNTLTGQPIKTREEFDAWHSAFETAKLERDLKSGKLSPETLSKAISESPEMKQIRALLEQNGNRNGYDSSAPLRSAQDDKSGAEASAYAKAQMDRQIAEIHKIDPTINTIADLLKMDRAKEFYKYVMKGNSFTDAYYLAYREKLEQRTAEAAKAQSLSAARSKDHLKATNETRGTGAVDVPPEVMEQYRYLNPGKSDKEIREHYNRTYRKE